MTLLRLPRLSPPIWVMPPRGQAGLDDWRGGSGLPRGKAEEQAEEIKAKAAQAQTEAVPG